VSLGPQTDEACGDTVSAIVCMVVDFVFGPSGVVPFAQQEAAWAVDTAQDLLPPGV
jgi:hypothetical protein